MNALRWLPTLVLTILFCGSGALADPTASSALTPQWTIERAKQALGPGMRVLTDQKGEMSFEEVRQAWQDGHFLEETRNVPNYGFTGSAFWFHFAVQIDERIEGPWYFLVENPLVDSIAVYYLTPDGSWQQKTSGDRLPFGQRDIKNRFFYFQLPLSSESLTPVFVRMQTQGSAQFAMSIENQASILATDHESQIAQGIFIGLMTIMIAYYLLLAIGSRSVEYGVLSLYWSSILLFKLVMNGLAFEYLWPTSAWWANVASAFSVPFVFLMAGLVTYTFLDLRRYPKLSWFFRVAMAVLAAGTVGSFILPYSTLKIFLLVGLSLTVAIFVASIHTLLQGQRSARFFLLSWLSMIVAALSYGLEKSGVFPVSVWTTYAIELGAGTHVLLMAISASDKINAINLAIREAQKLALASQIEARRITETMNVELERQVKERTEELWQQSKGIRVMLDSMQQGICTIDRDGQILAPYSPFLERLVGQRELAGVSLYSTLFERSSLSPEELSQLRSAVEFSFGQDTLGFIGNEHLFPHQVQFQNSSGTLDLEIDWAPVEDQEGRVQKILAVIRDTSSIRKAEQTAAARQRELEMIGQILNMPASKFQRFVLSSEHLLAECEQIINQGPTAQTWQSVLRNIHTMKGNARTYAFHDLSDLIHQSESHLCTLEPQKQGFEPHLALSAIERIRTQLEAYRQIHDDKLKRKGQADLETSLLELSRSIKSHWQSLPGELRQVVEPLFATLDRIHVSSFQTLLVSLIESLPDIAASIGRKTPHVTVRGVDFSLDDSAQELLEDIFVHLFRNSLDHGFHQDTDHPEIFIDIEHRSDMTRILYHDTGRGLHLQKLLQLGIQRQLITETASETEIAELMFRSGVSSSAQVSELSGRGLGMDAVKVFVERLGGSLQLSLTGPGWDANHRQFSLAIALPPQKLVAHIQPTTVPPHAA